MVSGPRPRRCRRPRHLSICQSPGRNHGRHVRAAPHFFPSTGENVTHPPYQVCLPMLPRFFAYPPHLSISFIIPVDLVDLISSHALLSQCVPSLLDIPASFTLDRLSSLRDTRFQALQPLPPPPPFLSTFAALTKQTPQSHFRTRSHVSDALHAALNSGIDYGQDTRIRTEQVTLTGFRPETNVSVSLSMSSRFSESYPSPMETPLFLPPFSRTPSTTITPKTIPYRQSTRNPPPFTIGNLFLSSCPGKKGIFTLAVLLLALTYFQSALMVL